MKKFFHEVAVHIVGATLAAIVLSVVFFIFSDYVFNPPDLNGRWLVGVVTENTRYDAYKNLVCYYEVILHQDENKITGTAELIGDLDHGKARVYDYAKRVRVELAGSISRNYIRKDTVNIHWLQHGELRDSSTYFKILRFDDNYMTGNFETTVAYGSGKSEWVRQNSQFKFIPADTNIFQILTRKD